jgi:catechol 2,3-dioxygenase-like lactoylglutathione lyase family enzyme
MKFNGLMPELYVSDYKKSLAFYVDLLGFKLEYNRTDPSFAFLSYGEAQLMIQQQEKNDWHAGSLEHPYGRGINFQIRTPDINAVVEKLNANDYPIQRGIKESKRKAGEILVIEKEIHVLDPDGYFLRFSEEVEQSSI